MESVLGSIAALIPIAVQWMRAQKRIPEWQSFAVIVASSLLAYWLFSPGDPGTREFWQGSVQWLIQGLGINQAASSAANMGVPGIPRTNSR